MREILFRGKRVDNKEWVYGYYVKNEFGKHYILSGKHRSGLREGDDCNCLTLKKHEVIPETVGQYIDRKNKYKEKIFAGDILKVKMGGYWQRTSYVVEYEKYGWKPFIEGERDRYYYITECEVIGNIYKEKFIGKER